MFCWGTVMVAGILPGLLAEPAPAPAPAETAVRKSVERLDPKNAEGVRREALRWLTRHAAPENAALVLPALERCLRADPAVKVREQAALDLGEVAKRLGKPCPLVLLEALLDQEPVRYAAEAEAGCFRTFPPGAVEVLLRCVWSEDDGVRGTGLLLLAQAAPRDGKVLAVIETARQDRSFVVRHNAYCARFKATDRLDEFLAYFLRLSEDPEALLRPVPQDRELRERERNVRNLAVLGAAVRMIEWSEQRPDELASALMKLLDDRSPVLRRGAARIIGAVAIKVDLGDPARQTDAWRAKVERFLGPDAGSEPPKGGAKPAERPQKSKAALRLEKLHVTERLRKLCDSDPDPSVAAAARAALARWAQVQEKRPEP